VQEVWGLLLLVVRRLLLLELKIWKVGLVWELVRRLLLLRGSWVVENLLRSLLRRMDGLGRRMGRREKAAGLGKMMRGR
jgi:hypothetical protein